MTGEPTTKSKVHLRNGDVIDASESTYKIWDDNMLAADAREFSRFTYIPTSKGGAIVRLEDISKVVSADE